jgi:hypothetical protein
VVNIRVTRHAATLAHPKSQQDTVRMGVPARSALLAAALCLGTHAASADEIRLKDGKKLYGVIVAYEDNMFKVKTDFGFVLVEKDKIASIVPTTPAKDASSTASKPADAPENASKRNALPASVTASGKPGEASESATTKSKIPSGPVRPALPSASNAEKVTPPAMKLNERAATPMPAVMQPLAPLKEPEQPANREQVQGTLYTNFSHGFRMYKAPSWEIIDDARKALPNAIVAMGTSNESTLMVVGQETMKESLEASANGVEKRLREIYSNYRMLSRRKTVVGGAPAIEFKYRGMADEHDWSGTLVVVSRGKDVLTMLGMTYADNDLIQIQENVIARTISSTDFNVH